MIWGFTLGAGVGDSIGIGVGLGLAVAGGVDRFASGVVSSADSLAESRIGRALAGNKPFMASIRQPLGSRTKSIVAFHRASCAAGSVSSNPAARLAVFSVF